MSDALERQIFQIAADVFDLPLGTVARETSSQTIKGWDSIQHLNFVLALEQELAIALEPREIEQILSVGAAVDVVRRKRGI